MQIRSTSRLALAASVGLVVLGLGPVTAGQAATGNAYTPYATSANGGEPSIGFDPNANAAVYSAGTATKRLTWDDSVSPAPVTVADAKAPTSVATLDAITFTDQKTHRTFVDELAGACSLLSLSDDAGKTYTPSPLPCGVGTLLDHQTVGGGPFHSPLPADPVYPDAVYYCAQNSYSGTCAVSLDGGLSFNEGVPAYNTPANATNDPNPMIAAAGGACSALHGHIRVGPDGTAYLPLKGCGGKATTANLTNTEFAGGHPALSVTRDNGTTWLVRRVDAGDNSDESDPSVAAGRGDKTGGLGRVYFGWEDGKNVPDENGYGLTSSAKIAVSSDNGTTFSTPVDVSAPLGIKNVQFPEVIAGDDDRAAFAWLGTTSPGDDQHTPAVANAVPQGAIWHLYISTTYDAGRTWSTVDTTPTDPVQHGCVDLQGTSNKTVQDPNICNQRNLLDFNDITVDKQGRVLAAYGDGCTGTCVTNPAAASSGAAGMVMRQSTGAGLYAAFDGVFGDLPPATVPEVGHSALLLVGALGVVGTLVLSRRRRGRRGTPAC